MNRSVAVGRLFHESNGFNPRVTEKADFQIEHGQSVLDACAGSGTTLRGIVDALAERNAEVFPVLSAVAPPSGLVNHNLYLEFRDTWVRGLADLRLDAVTLELHGAMATTEIDDVEGDFLRHMREALGPAVWIGVGLDLHAHITPAMLQYSDICIACKENPHSDVVQCGQRVVELVYECMAGTLRPFSTMAKTRTILPGALTTSEGPLKEIHDQAKKQQEANPAIRDISIYNVFRFLDVKDIGQAAVVLSDGPIPKAKPIAEDIVNEFWRRREEFVDELLSIDDTLNMIRESRKGNGKPYVLADMGDRVLAGAPGDSNSILAHCLREGNQLTGVIPMTDPESVKQAEVAGIGAEIVVDIGGRFTPGYSPLQVKAEVLSLSDGLFQINGPYQAGEMAKLGKSAVVLIDDRIYVLLTTNAGFTHDPAAIESQGIDWRNLDFVTVKSGYHFALNFNGLATPVLVKTPGIAYYVPGTVERNLGRFWPEHDVSGDRFLPTEVFG